MIGRRCNCGCRARLDVLNLRAHARYASRSCRSRDWSRKYAKASNRLTQSRIQATGTCEARHVALVASLDHSPTESGPYEAPLLSSMPSRDCSTRRSFAPAREASARGDCTVCGREVELGGGNVRCPKGCATEPESSVRAAVRWAYRDYPDRMRYLPASHEGRRRPMKGYRQAPIDRFLTALADAGCIYRPARSVDEWEAQCPTHDDQRPTLVIRRNGNGSLWFKCWRGCPKEGILSELDLEWRDLWEASEHDYGRREPVQRASWLPQHLRQAMLDLLRQDEERRAA